jgi:hypothetical protein
MVFRIKGDHKLSRSEINHRHHERHREEDNARTRKWKADHRDYIARANKEYKATLSKEKIAEYNRRSRQNHLEEKRAKDRLYRATHKEERKMYDRLVYFPRRKLQNRTRWLSTTLNGKPLVIKGLLKRSYPSDSCCELCHGVKGRLAYHHWEDTEEILRRVALARESVFLRGIWICQPCNNFVHRLTQFPDLVNAWFELKEKLDELLEDQTYPY